MAFLPESSGIRAISILHFPLRQKLNLVRFFGVAWCASTITRRSCRASASPPQPMGVCCIGFARQLTGYNLSFRINNQRFSCSRESALGNQTACPAIVLLSHTKRSVLARTVFPCSWWTSDQASPRRQLVHRFDQKTRCYRPAPESLSD
jgi:hypothetical protein